MTHRMGWAPLAQMIAASMPQPAPRFSPAPIRFTETEQAKRRLLDMPRAPAKPLVDGWKKEPPSEPGWYMAGTINAMVEKQWRIHWGGKRWGACIGMRDTDYMVEIGDKQHLIVWLRKCTAEEIGT